MNIEAAKTGIRAGTDVSETLNALFASLAGIPGHKELTLEPGVYFLTAENCPERTLYITNTVGDAEFRDGQIPHRVRVGLLLENIRDLTLRGTGVIFEADGKMTNMALTQCETITIEGIEFRHKNPALHELTVERVTPFSVDFRLDADSVYQKTGGRYYFIGRNFRTPFYENRSRLRSWGWYGKIFADNENHIQRGRHPLAGAFALRERSPHCFRAHYLRTGRFHKGETYCIFNTRRENVGIFLDRCKDMTFTDLRQRFNYSLAFVAQDSEAITVDRAQFRPASGQAKKLVSLADFFQFCMCRGAVRVTNSDFCGAADDCLNIHGIHFQIVAVAGNSLTLRFMHAQTHGFNPLRPGDRLAIVNPDTLLAVGETESTASELLNETDLRVDVKNAADARAGLVVEDVSACASLLFRGNRMTRIITRGLLVTTHGDVTIADNDFDNTEMAAILLSDDAKNWYESGPCDLVLIRGNRFGDCGAYNLQILPENGDTGSVVHGEVTVEGNRFESPRNGGIDATCVQTLRLQNNRYRYPRPDFVRTRNVPCYKPEKQ